jgi:1-acyl-sn-glycerol-3-phosphate acyltransferase
LNGNRPGAAVTSTAKAAPAQLARRLRSSAFVALFACYALTIMELGHRLIVWPMVTLLPRRRPAIMRVVLRIHARATLAMARWLADVHVRVHGRIPAESCIVVMNHQSVLDIPLGVWLMHGPQTVIPTRDRYGRGIPGISTLTRLSEFPLVAQGRTLTREELRDRTRAAELVGRGERSMLIFPEGHRTEDGGIGRFMRSGLRIVMANAPRPVYCVVADGMTRARTTADALAGFAHTTISVRVLGPFDPPEDTTAESVDRFAGELRDRMIETLAAIRQESAAAVSMDPRARHAAH